MNMQERLAAARGDAEADLVLRGGRLINVFSGAIEETDIVIGVARRAARARVQVPLAQVVAALRHASICALLTWMLLRKVSKSLLVAGI